MVKNLKLFTVLAFYSVFNVANAQFTKVNNLMKKVETGLHGLAIVTITVAIIWVGYKVLFLGNSLRDCGNVIFGAALIAGASEIAALFMG